MLMTSIELLAPARNLSCGMAAVDHGADAVYIGASDFGARQAAGNDVEDIRVLCTYAHRYGVRIYVTLNTILYDEELTATERLAWQLYEAGVDAFIVQDMALLRLNMPPVPLHASTQMDNRTPEKVQWLYGQGFSQIVLARELSLQDISAIHTAVPEASLEAFVHGALCVSLSGRCNASQHCFSRSANRGACAQFCRLPFDLEDADGRVLVAGKHLLSLRDMNRSALLEQMIDAGVRSFKIEGRLKDEAYVKNVTAYYRQQLNRIISRRSDLCRASLGDVTLSFQPDLGQSFSRGYTDYFLKRRTPELASMDTPKSIGQPVGVVKDVRGNTLIVAGSASFNNGDGLCFVNARGEVEGFRINRVEGNHLQLLKSLSIPKGTPLWRSHNQQWERMMEGSTAERRISIHWKMDDTENRLTLSARTDDGMAASLSFTQELQLAEKPQDENIRQVLSKLGDTPFTAASVSIACNQQWFVPRSLLTEWRRQVVGQLEERISQSMLDERERTYKMDRQRATHENRTSAQSVEVINVSNRQSLSFYQSSGFKNIQLALETNPEAQAQPLVLMRCRYCLRYELGFCPRHQQPPRQPREPLYLVSRDGKRFRLRFDCRACMMMVEES